jgi:lipoic acid synthetase
VALPAFLVKRVPKQQNIRQIRQMLENSALHTVCESASCPNIGECFSRQTLTFMILGDVCTRHCAFCGVNKGQPLPVNPNEPQHIAEAVEKLKLNYVVITSVTRDDLEDGGASHFAAVISQLRTARQSSPQAPNSELRTEVLIPDFQGDQNALKLVLDAKPYVLNHNVETIPRLYDQVRPQADYARSLNLLANSKKINPAVYTKSGFMVGLGEDKDEVFGVLQDLRAVGCDIATIGQYLPPTRSHLPAKRFVLPEEFLEYETFGRQLGLKVHAGPFVRSSYRAEEIAK